MKNLNVYKKRLITLIGFLLFAVPLYSQIKNTNSKTMKNHYFEFKSFLIVCVFILINNRFLAQNPIDLNELITPSTTSNSTNSLQQLSRGAVPTIYLKQGLESTTDPQNKAVRIITDIASINQLYQQNQLYKDVELILIQIENESDMNWSLNPNSLSQFENLQYIYISSSIPLCDPSNGNSNCEKEKIISFLSGELCSSITLVYSSEVSE
jgi:hypothetical protein